MLEISLGDLLTLIFMGGGIVACLIIGVSLLLRKEGLRKANIFLGMLLILFALTLTNSLINLTGIASRYQYLYFLPISFSLSIGPLLYFYLRARTQASFSFKKIDLLHFVLPLLEFGFYLIIGFRSAEFKSMMWREVISPYLQYVEGSLYFMSRFFYLILAFNILLRHRERMTQNWEKIEWRWLYRFLLVLTVLISLTLIYDLTELIAYNVWDVNIYNLPWVDLPLSMAYAAASYWMAFHAYTHSHQALIIPTPKIPTKAPQHDEQKVQLKQLMAEEKLYLNPELDLAVLSKMMGLTKNQLSALINEEGMNFSQWLNGYRIEAFKDKVQDPAYSHLSLLGMAFEVGFNSKATFHRVFKQQTGQTPSQYVKSQVSIST